jgi:hypothetical protein
VYSRQIDGQTYTFGVSGKLLRNIMVMYDRETESLWSQLLGRAVKGPLDGTQLTYLPSWLTTWEDWKSRHPDTLALVKGYKGSRDPYQDYYENSQAGVLGEWRQDDRLAVKQFVVGVTQGDEAVAYPWITLNDEPVVNDVMGNVPILVVFYAETGASAVFDRRVGGQVLTFSLAEPDAPSEEIFLIDAETGSRWLGLTGRAIDGPLVGETLAHVKSTSSFWFGWKDNYPGTRVYTPNP